MLVSLEKSSKSFYADKTFFTLTGVTQAEINILKEVYSNNTKKKCVSNIYD